MSLQEKTDEEIIKIAKPIWDNLIQCSNNKDYSGFTKNFSAQMLYGANEIEIEAEVIVDNRCEAGGVVVPKISDEQGINGLANLDGKPVWLDVKKV